MGRGERFGYGDGPLSIAGQPWTTTMRGAAFGGSGVTYSRSSRSWCGAACRGPPAHGALLPRLRGPGGHTRLVAAAPFVVRVLGPLPVVAAAGLEHVLAPARRRMAGAAAVGVLAVQSLTLPPFVRLHERDGNTGEKYLTHVRRDVPAGVVLEPERA